VLSSSEERVLIRNFFFYCKAADDSRGSSGFFWNTELRAASSDSLIWAYFISHGHIPESIRTRVFLSHMQWVLTVARLLWGT